MSIVRPLCISLALALLIALLLPAVAAAHADLLRSDPAANAVLSAAPAQATIWFTEPIEPGFSTISVLYQDGSTADSGDSTVSPADATQLSVTLSESRPGTYVVAWRVLSAVDGHITSGSFAYAVGGPVDQSVSREAGGAVTSPLDMLARALSFVGQAVLAGSLLFRWLVWRPALKAAEVGEEADDAAVRRNRIVVYVALGIASAGALLALVAQSSAAGAPIGAWLGTRIGRMWIGRVATLVALGVLADDLAAAGQRGSRSRAAYLAVNAVLFWLCLQLLLTTSLTSHSASVANPPLAPLLADWLHLIAGAIWIGGLAQMAFVVPAATRALDAEDRAWLWLRSVVYFSTMAAFALGILMVSGVYMAFLHVGAWNALLSTPYGRTLLFKLGLAGVAMLIGAFNLFYVKPRLDRAVDEPQAESSRRVQHRFRRIVAVEASVGLAVLASAGVLTALPRSKDPQPAASGTGLSLAARAEDLDAQLTIDPAASGDNVFTLRLIDASTGQPISDATNVSLRFSYLARSLGSSEAEAGPASDGAFTASGAYLSLPGEWQIEAAVRRPDAFDAFAAYRVKVGLDGRIVPAGETTLVESVERWLSIYGLAFGGAVALALGVIWLPIAMKAARNTAWQVALMVPAVIAIPIGAWSLWTFFSEATPGLALTNPMLPDEASLSIGRNLFEANCATCHGPAGRGDGPEATNLPVPPPDYGNAHLDIHTDGDIFYWIREGLPTANSPMPKFRDRLTEEETWHLVNYVRRLRDLAAEDSVAAGAASALQLYTPPSFIAPPEAVAGATPLMPTPSAPSDPEAIALLRRADAAMNELTSMVEKQSLRDDAANRLDAVFTYAAPDAMRYQIVNGPSAIQIGSDDYQLGPDGRWIANRRAVPFEWPRFYYAEVASGASITARESVGDAQATVVDFEFGGYQFRVWIDNLTARILQLSMDSPNHHMIAVYTDFDSAPPIERPTSLAP